MFPKLKNWESREVEADRQCPMAKIIKTYIQMNRSLLIEFDDQVKSDVRYAFLHDYVDYIDTLVRESDIYYLRNKNFAREIAAGGHRSCLETIFPDDYTERQKLAYKSIKPIPSVPVVLSISTHLPAKDSFLEALMVRERANRLGLLSTIIFMRVKSKKGHLMSGFIDYFHRLTMTDMSRVFSGQELLTPNKSDLCYYVYPTEQYARNDTVLYQTLIDKVKGLRFLFKEDNLIVDPNSADPGKYTHRLEIKNKRFLELVMFDHAPRRRTFS